MEIHPEAIRQTFIDRQEAERRYHRLNLALGQIGRRLTQNEATTFGDRALHSATKASTFAECVEPPTDADPSVPSADVRKLLDKALAPIIGVMYHYSSRQPGSSVEVSLLADQTPANVPAEMLEAVNACLFGTSDRLDDYMERFNPQ